MATGDQTPPMPLVHTPGPWRFHLNENGVEWDVRYDDKDFNGDDAWNVASVLPDCAGASTEANARLIAAAPDMLAALKAALHDYTLNSDIAEIVEAAIDKATVCDRGSPVAESNCLIKLTPTEF